MKSIIVPLNITIFTQCTPFSFPFLHSVESAHVDTCHAGSAVYTAPRVPAPGLAGPRRLPPTEDCAGARKPASRITIKPEAARKELVHDTLLW